MAEFKQMRRHLPVSVVCRSETMYRYLGQKGSQLIGATQRIATMYEATEDNDDNRNVVISIFDTHFENMEQSQVEFARQADAVKRKVRKRQSLPEVQVPDNHKFTVDVTHPIFQRVLAVIRKLDNSMAIMEVLWMMGELDEERYKYAKMKLASSLSRFSNDVFRVTNQLRSLDSGRGTTQQRVNQQINQQLAPVEEVEAVPVAAAGGEIAGQDTAPLSTEEVNAVISQSHEETLKETA